MRARVYLCLCVCESQSVSKGMRGFLAFDVIVFKTFKNFGGKDVSIILLMPRSFASMALGSANLRGEAIAISAGSVSLVPLPRVIFSS